uniref:Uncharacterized protein n=1 Tax=viral metagenome TaxID=1070528 RepID=A0A6C0KJ64_9ZZZZ
MVVLFDFLFCSFSIVILYNMISHWKKYIITPVTYITWNIFKYTTIIRDFFTDCYKKYLKHQNTYFLTYNSYSNTTNMDKVYTNDDNEDVFEFYKNKINESTLIIKIYNKQNKQVFIRISPETLFQESLYENIIPATNPFINIDLEQDNTFYPIYEHFKKFCINNNTILDNLFLKWYLLYFYNITLADKYKLHIMDKYVTSSILNETTDNTLVVKA